jgi:hypothetical protein
MNETRLPILIPDTANRPEWLKTPETSWISSYVDAPLNMNNHLFGFIAVNSQTAGFFTQTYLNGSRRLPTRPQLLSITAKCSNACRTPTLEVFEAMRRGFLSLIGLVE